MGKKDVKTFDGSGLSVWHAIDSANAYYELSMLFTSQVKNTLAEVAQQTMRYDMAAASATNRLLALELYLKALLVASGVPVPETHDFVNLFDALPERHRVVIQAEYDARIRLIPEVGATWGLEVLFGVGQTDLSDAEVAKQIPSTKIDRSLRALLIRNRKGFVESRYLFTTAKRGKVSCFNYEHQPLAVLCGVLCEGLEHSLTEKQPGYQRRFRF